MHLLGIARVRPGLLTHGFNRRKIECAEIILRFGFAPAAHLHGLGAAFLQRRIIEEGIRPRAEDFRGKRRRLGQIAREDADAAALKTAQHIEPAIDIHRLVQAIVERLRDQGVIGNLPLADDVFETGNLIRKHRGEQILGFHALQLRCHLLAAGKARQGQRRGRRPAPAHAKQRRIEQGLDEDVLRRRRMQVTRYLDQRKAVAGRQRQDDGILGRRRLQFKIEGAAKAFAQSQAPGLVDAAAERRVHDQLRAAGFIEEALEDNLRARRQHAQRIARTRQIVDQLLRGDRVDADLFDQPAACRSDAALDFRRKRLQPRCFKFFLRGR